MENDKKITPSETLSLTKKRAWENFVSTKLNEMKVNKELHPKIISGIELLLPMLIVIVPCFIIGIVSGKK